MRPGGTARWCCSGSEAIVLFQVERYASGMVVRVSEEFSDEEGNRLRRIVRHGQNAIEMKRAQVIMASAQGLTPPKIAVIALMSEDYVRQFIHAFNLHGFSMLKPHWVSGPKAKFTEAHREGLVGTGDQPSEGPGTSPTPSGASRGLREEAVKAGCWWTGSSGRVTPSHPTRIGGEPSETCERGRRKPDPEREVKKQGIIREAHPNASQSSRGAERRSSGIVGFRRVVGYGYRTTAGVDYTAEYSKEYGTTYYFLALNVYHQQLSGQGGLGRSTR